MIYLPFIFAFVVGFILGWAFLGFCARAAIVGSFTKRERQWMKKKLAEGKARGFTKLQS